MKISNQTNLNYKSILKMIADIIMLGLSLCLLIKGGTMSFQLLSNPDLDIATELVRFLWGIIGTVYFAFLIVKNLQRK